MANIIQFQIFKQFPELDCRFYGKDIDGWVGKNNTVSMKQVHGNRIVNVYELSTQETIGEADGLITQEKNIWLKVGVADCVPIFCYEPKIKMIGVAHAGWKGTLKEIAGKMVLHIVRHGGRAENIFVATGPYIHDCCYNVGDNRFLEFKNLFPNEVFKKPRFLDLGKICALQMIKLGVPEKHIEISGICTKCNHGDFFSYRAGDRNVNNVGIIGIVHSEAERERS